MVQDRSYVLIRSSSKENILEGGIVVTPSQPTRWSGERHELLSEDRGRAPAGNAFWHILKATERSFLHLQADALSSSNGVSYHIWRQGRGLGSNCPHAPEEQCLVVIIY